MGLPLADIRVVDFSSHLAGPFTAMLMADQGADVIKVEPPEGDHSRTLVPIPGTKDLSLGYLTFNRNKRGMVLDLTKPGSRELAYRLVHWADVLVINLRLDSRRKHGLTYEDTAPLNPRLVYASLTAYGEVGPDAALPGVDVAIQPRVGDLDVRRPPNGPPPASSVLTHFDMAAASFTFTAVLLALRERDRTGFGQKVEVNLLQTALALQAKQMTAVVGLELAYGHKQSSLSANHLCSDGRYLYAPIGAARWDSYCRAIRLDHLIQDPRFDTPEKRSQNAQQLGDILSRHLATRPAVEWESRIKPSGHYVTVIRSFSEVFDDPQVVANDMITQYRQPGLGQVKVINVPFKLSGTEGQPRFLRHAPTKGEHTDEVLRELGCSPEEVQALRGEGAVA